MKVKFEQNIRPGDHVIQWTRQFTPGQLKASQQHGIVLSAAFDSSINDVMVTIADFAQKHHRQQQYCFSIDPRGHHLNLPFQGKRRIAAFHSPAREWTKVDYSSTMIDKIFTQAGTSTALKSDPIDIVLARVHFLLASHRSGIKLKAATDKDCEVICVWCKTGVWNTLQGASWSHIMRNKGLDSTTAQASAAFVAAASKYAFWKCLGQEVEAGIACGFPVLASASAIGGAAMNVVFLQWLGTAAKDWNQPLEKVHQKRNHSMRRKKLVSIRTDPPEEFEPRRRLV